MQPMARVRGIERGGTHLVLRLESWLGTSDARLRFERHGDRVLWIPPTEKLAEAVPEELRDATGELRRSSVDVFLHNVDDESEYLLPARNRVRLEVGRRPPAGSVPGCTAPSRSPRRPPRPAARCRPGSGRSAW